MKFREWLQIRETMTSTSCIAGFSRPIGAMQRRLWPIDWGGWYSDRKKKKKPLEQPQVKESSDPREGSTCPHCGSTDTVGARSVEKDQDGKFVAFANAHCRGCDNGFGFKF